MRAAFPSLEVLGKHDVLYSFSTQSLLRMLQFSRSISVRQPILYEEYLVLMLTFQSFLKQGRWEMLLREPESFSIYNHVFVLCISYLCTEPNFFKHLTISESFYSFFLSDTLAKILFLISIGCFFLLPNSG